MATKQPIGDYATVDQVNTKVSYSEPQTLTPEQQAQARENIGAVGYTEAIAGYERSSANLNSGIICGGYFDANTEYYYTAKAVCDQNYVPVEGGRSITWWHDSVRGGNICTYDADKNWIGLKYIDRNKAYALDNNVAYVRWQSWTGNNDAAGTKVAIYYAEDAKSEYEEYEESPYYEKAIPSEQVKSEKGQTIIEQIGHITPEMFGAVGNGAIDDTVALASCINYAKNNNSIIKGVNTYRIAETLIIDFNNFDIEINKLKYDGTDCAVKFVSCNNGRATIKEIMSEFGNGVWITTDASNMCGYNNFTFGIINANDYCIKVHGERGIQYNNIYFDKLCAVETCIYLEYPMTGTSGWLTECRWHGGQLSGKNGAVNYGIKAIGNPEQNNNLSTQRFYNVGFEGVNIGCYMSDVHGFVFNDPRTSEAINDKVFKLVGTVLSCTFRLNHFYLKWLDYSELHFSEGFGGTMGNHFYGSFYSDGGVIYDFSSFTICSNGSTGVMQNVNQTKFGYGRLNANHQNVTFDTSHYDSYILNEFWVDSYPGAITLDSRYYNSYNINTIYMFISYGMTSEDILQDSDGNFILNFADYEGKLIKLTKFDYNITLLGNLTNGWLIEVIDDYATAKALENLNTSIQDKFVAVEEDITNLNTLVGDTAVSAQISTAITGLATESYVNNAISQAAQVQIITWEADD